MNLQSILRSKFTTGLLVVLFCAVAFITVELYWQKREVDSEVKRLQTQADAVSKDNEKLSELIKYLDTPEYKEKEAREKLNLKKEGEQVVVLPESNNNSAQNASDLANQRSNPNKWLDYFFKQ
jgi:cell division protein FtsB